MKNKMAEKLPQVFEEVTNKVTENLADPIIQNDETALAQVMAIRYHVQECIKAFANGHIDELLELSNAGIQMLMEIYGQSYASWDANARSSFGLILAFYHFTQGFYYTTYEQADQAFKSFSHAVGIEECQGNLLDLAQFFKNYQSPEGQTVSRLTKEAEIAFKAHHFTRAVEVCTRGIDLIEKEQRSKPDWAGNNLAELYTVRGTSNAQLGGKRSDKQLLRLALEDFDHVRSFPDSYFLSSAFKADVQNKRDHVKKLLNKSGGCFIATATYGSPLAQEVITLCQYRDTRLRSNWLGSCLISFYERFSPPLAAWIAERPKVRTWVQRWILSPAIWLVQHGISKDVMD